MGQSPERDCLISFWSAPIGIVSFTGFGVMKILLLFGILFLIGLSALGLVIALYRHKRNATRHIRIVGEIARVDAALAPEGTVFIGGELWRAKSKDGRYLGPHERVRVIGFEGHLAVVESYN